MLFDVLTTTEVAYMADVSRHTVGREIRHGNLKAERIGRQWSIDLAEAERWRVQFRPYAGLRKGNQS